MQLASYVQQVQAQLAAAAALGDESTRAVAEVLATAAEPAVRLAVLSVVSSAADEITAALLDSPGAPIISVGIDGDDLRVAVRPSEPRAADGDVGIGEVADSDSSARISLRLPESLKSQVEASARIKGISVNTWILHAMSSAVSSPGSRWRVGTPWDGGSGHHLTGWING